MSQPAEEKLAETGWNAAHERLHPTSCKDFTLKSKPSCSCGAWPPGGEHPLNPSFFFTLPLPIWSLPIGPLALQAAETDWQRRSRGCRCFHWFVSVQQVLLWSFFPPLLLKAAGTATRWFPTIVALTRATMWKHASVAMLLLLLPFLCWLCVKEKKERKHPVATVTTMTTRVRNQRQGKGWIWCLTTLRITISRRLLPVLC